MAWGRADSLNSSRGGSLVLALAGGRPGCQPAAHDLGGMQPKSSESCACPGPISEDKTGRPREKYR